MFSVFCPRHQQRVLLTASEILSLDPAPGGGFAIDFRCFCGHEGRWFPGGSEENCEECPPAGLGVSPGNGRREPPRMARMAG